jgi:N-acetylglutamate synthase-like GNAT family acetyltransferase
MKLKFRIRNDIRPGDLMEIADLHEFVYSEEYGYNDEFTEFVKQTLVEFDRPLSDREKIWIVEQHDMIMGCIAVVEHSKEEAQIRWFLVHPSIRRCGIGTMLFREAVDFIKENGYSSTFLFTQDILQDAARVYVKFGFELEEEGPEKVMWGIKDKEQIYRWKLE